MNLCQVTKQHASNLLSTKQYTVLLAFQYKVGNFFRDELNKLQCVCVCVTRATVRLIEVFNGVRTHFLNVDESESSIEATEPPPAVWRARHVSCGYFTDCQTHQHLSHDFY